MEEKKEYLSEEEYQKNQKKLKRVGKILLILGVVIFVISIVLYIMGFAGFSNTVSNGFNSIETGNISDNNMIGGAFGSFGMISLGMFLSFIGISLCMIGGFIMFIAHRREITAFSTEQVMPVAKEGVEKMTPTAASSAKEISKEVTKGIKEGLKDEE